MKKLAVILFLVIAILGGFVYVNLWWKKVNTPIAQNESFQDFLIVKGSSAISIGNKLEEEGLIRSSFAFKVYSQITGKSKKIQAGEYRLSPDMSLSKIVDQLTKGPLELWVTVPEGLRREEIVEKFIVGLGKKGDEAQSFREEFLQESDGMEGYLFPDTYLFPKTASASLVVSKMRSTFDTKIAVYEEEIAQNELTLKEIVTLASIIERETKTDEERPLVAGVLLNRVDLGMPLQADATVQYAIANTSCQGKVDCEWWPTILRDDLEINSPYNTYEFRGLPPAPIANPGTSSLKAAINPKDSDYYYYLHEPSGEIHFAETLDEHNSNVRRYLGK
jgi:UPF0755 protein